MPASDTPPPGYHSVTPRVVVEDVSAFIAFLNQVFETDAVPEVGRPTDVRIGDSLLMVSEVGERAAFPALLYVYVDDVEDTHRHAVAAGATVIEEPIDQPYGDRRAMFEDRFGNVFQVARRL